MPAFNHIFDPENFDEDAVLINFFDSDSETDADDEVDMEFNMQFEEEEEELIDWDSVTEYEVAPLETNMDEEVRLDAMIRYFAFHLNALQLRALQNDLNAHPIVNDLDDADLGLDEAQLAAIEEFYTNTGIPRYWSEGMEREHGPDFGTPNQRLSIIEEYYVDYSKDWLPLHPL